MPMTRQQAQALAHFVNLCRPGWDEQGVMAQLSKLATRNPLDVALATIRATADEQAVTPGVIAKDGPHWRERAVNPDRPSNTAWPPRRQDECRMHPGQWRGSCNACAVDRYGDDGQPTEHEPRSGEDWRAVARAGIHAAQEQRRRDDAAYASKRAETPS